MMGTTATLFLTFVAAWAVVLCLVVNRYCGRTSGLAVLCGLAVWGVYVGTLSRLGVVGDAAARPPGIVFVIGPLIAFIAVWAVSSASALRVASAVPIALLLGLQVFRIGVEVFLHRLWLEGLVPKTLTFGGANVDLWLGVSAPLVAWMATKGPIGIRIAVVWNVAGLASLANVVVRSALTAPGPLHLVHAEVLNRAVGTFPYTFIAGFLAPSAVLLHVLCLRAIRARTVTGSIGRTLGLAPEPGTASQAAAPRRFNRRPHG